MNELPRLDPSRSSQIRAMLLEVASATSTAPPRQRLSRRSIAIIVAAVVLALAGTGGAAYAIVNSPLISTPSASPGGNSTHATVPH